MSFAKLDQSAASADSPLTGALVQGIAQNGEACIVDRLRRGGCTWDYRDPPRMCGGYSYTVPSADGEPNMRTSMLVAFRRSSLDVDEIRVRVRCQAFDGDVTVGVVVLGITDLWPQRMRPNDAEAVVSPGSVETVSLTVSGLAPRDEDLLILVTALSERAGPWTLVGAPTAWDPFSLEFPSGSITADERSTRAVLWSYEPPIGLGQAWNERGLPSPRQVKLIDHLYDGVNHLAYIWPPIDTDSISYSFGLTDVKLYLADLSYVDVYGIEAEETSHTGVVPVGSALNPGQVASARVHSDAVYGRAEQAFLEQTRVHHAGPPAPRPQVQDQKFLGEALNKVHSFVPGSSTAQALASCYVNPTQAANGAENVTYEALALLAVADVGPRGAPRPYDFEARLRLSDLDGTSLVSGDWVDVRPMALSCIDGDTGMRQDNHPVGRLLRAAYRGSYTPTSVADPGLMSHALVGTYPVDVLRRARPRANAPEGNFIWVRLTLKDDTAAGDREIFIEVKTDEVRLPGAFIHLLSWCVTTTNARDLRELEGLQA